MKKFTFFKILLNLSFAALLPAMILMNNKSVNAQTTTSGIPTSEYNGGWPYCPFDNLDEYSWSAQIITAAELTAAGIPANASISKVAYFAYPEAYTPFSMYNQNVWMTLIPVTTTSFAGNQVYPNPNAPAWTEVLNSGTVSFSGSGWQTITFTSSFIWDGTSNIELEFENHGGQASSNMNNNSFYFASFDSYYSETRWLFGFNDASFENAELEISSSPLQNDAFLTQFTWEASTAITQPKTAATSININIYPNPVKQSSIINYRLSDKSEVILKIYDLTGNEVKTLVDGVQEKGEYNLNFTASNLNSGLYFYKIAAGNNLESGKIVKE